MCVHQKSCPVRNQRLVLRDPQSIGATRSARLLGRQLIEDGHITTPDLVHALELQSKMGMPNWAKYWWLRG